MAVRRPWTTRDGFATRTACGGFVWPRVQPRACALGKARWRDRCAPAWSWAENQAEMGRERPLPRCMRASPPLLSTGRESSLRFVFSSPLPLRAAPRPTSRLHHSPNSLAGPSASRLWRASWASGLHRHLSPRRALPHHSHRHLRHSRHHHPPRSRHGHLQCRHGVRSSPPGRVTISSTAPHRYFGGCGACRLASRTKRASEHAGTWRAIAGRNRAHPTISSTTRSAGPTARHKTGMPSRPSTEATSMVWKHPRC